MNTIYTLIEYLYSIYYYYMFTVAFLIKESMVTVECIIPQKHHRTVMGAKGRKVQSITSEYEVQVKFPDRDVYG